MNLLLLALAALPPLLYGGGSKAGIVVAFGLAAVVVVVTGTKLSVYGDALGERTGLGAGLVGLLFLAAVTSLPELVVSTTSTVAASLRAAGLAPEAFATPAAFAQARVALLRDGADLALGNMVGSNVMNLMIFVIMDLVQGRGAFLYRLSRNHVMSAASGLGLLGILLFGFAISNSCLGGLDLVLPVLAVGPATPLLFVAYLGIMLLQGSLEKRQTGMEGLEPETTPVTNEALLTMPAARFYGTLLVLAVVIVGCGMWLSLLGDRMAETFGLGQSFVGTIFLALSTSLPELVVCIAAVRIGCYNMAVGNVLGSNIFNLVIVFTADLGLRGGSLLFLASPEHLVTIAMVMILTCTVIAGLVYRSNRSFATLGIDVWLMLIVYGLGNTALYFMGAKEPEAPGQAARTERAAVAETGPTDPAPPQE